jgi:WD40 repeat protein
MNNFSYGQIRDEIFKANLKEDIFLDPPDPYFGWTSSELFVRTIAYNNDGTILATAGDNNEDYFTIINPVIKLWNPQKGSLVYTLSGHKKRIERLIFSGDGKLLASNSFDLTVKLWDVGTGKLLKDLSLGDAGIPNPFTISPDVRFLAYANHNEVYFYDIKGDSIYKILRLTQNYWIDDIAFSPDGKNIGVVGFFTSTAKCTVMVFDVEKLISLWIWTTESLATFESVKFTSDGSIIVANGPHPDLYLIDAKTGELLRSIPNGNLDKFCISPDSKIIALAKSKGRGGINFWSIDSAKLIKSIVFDYGYPLSLAFHPDGKKIAAGSVDSNNIRIYDISFTNSVETLETTSSYYLYQNYPNPFNPSTRINFNIPKSEFVSLKVFDVLGKEIAVLLSERKNAGSYSFQFNANNSPSGIYFYRLIVGAFSESKKMILVK